MLALIFERSIYQLGRGDEVTAEAGPLAYSELDDAIGFSTMEGDDQAHHTACTSRPHDVRETT
jgi:hypothetical protein